MCKKSFLTVLLILIAFGAAQADWTYVECVDHALHPLAATNANMYFDVDATEPVNAVTAWDTDEIRFRSGRANGYYEGTLYEVHATYEDPAVYVLLDTGAPGTYKIKLYGGFRIDKPNWNVQTSLNGGSWSESITGEDVNDVDGIDGQGWVTSDTALGEPTTPDGDSRGNVIIGQVTTDDGFIVVGIQKVGEDRGQFDGLAYQAVQAALVVGETDLSVSFDGLIYDRLVLLGCDVTVYDDDNVDNSDPNDPNLLSTTNASAYDVVVISESCSSSAVTELAYADVPIMDQEAYGWSRKDYTTDEGKGWGTSFTLADIVDDTHPIAVDANLTGQVLFFDEPGMAGTVIDVNGMAADAVSLLQVPDTNEVLVWVIEKGGVLATGDVNDVAVNRICGFGAIPGNASDVNLITVDGWALFDAAIAWLNPDWVPMPAMVAHWALDDSADDEVGDHDGTVVSGVSWIDGLLDGAATFDTTDPNAGITVANADDLDFGDVDFTISLLVCYPILPGDDEHQLIIKGSFGDDDSGSRYTLFNKKGEFRFEIDNGSADIKSGIKIDNDPVVTGEWVHVVLVRDAANDILSMYIDGELATSGTDSSGDISSGEDMMIGNTTVGNDKTCEADLDDIRIYPVALTEAEIGAIY